MDQLLHDLARLRHYGSMLQELMGELQRAAPQRSEGTDPSGMVRVLLGPDGVPETIRVSGYWKEKLQPASFGAAVTAACQAATQQRGAQWAETMQRAGWPQRLERLDSDATAAAAADANPVPPAFQRPGGGAAARPDDVLAEAAISALDGAMRRAATPAPPSGTGSTRGGTLEITLAPGGRLSCRADPGWVAQRSGAQLSEALAKVLAEARNRLTAASSAAETGAPGAGQSGRDDLLTEILSVLDDPQRLAER